MSVRVLVVAAACAALAFAPAPFPRPSRQRADSDDLTGVWQFTALEINGGPSGIDFSRFRIEITKDKIVFETERRSEWTLKLYPAASPAAFTWGQGEQITYAGCYRLVNGELTMAYAVTSSVASRATTFDRPPYKYVFRRIGR